VDGVGTVFTRGVLIDVAAAKGRQTLPIRWGGRPPTASMCQDAVVTSRSTGAARDEH